MPLYRGYCQASRILAPVFRKNIKNFPNASVPAGVRHHHLSDDRAVTRHSLYSVFFGKCSVKNRLFPKKNEKKSRTASFPWRTIFPRRIFAFFWKTLSKKPLFFEKKRDFFALAQKLSIGVTARQVAKWPLFSENFAKIFRMRPSPAGVRYHYPR